MARTLPPLNAVKAFEAAARHLSFTKAAAELCVTPAAVSQQVKFLEEYLEIKLFVREPKGLLLTELAQRCLPGLRDGFDKIALAMEKAVPRETVPTVNVTVSPSFASKWLVPRLDDFYASYPTIQVRVSCVMTRVNLKDSDGDIAVIYDFEEAERSGAELLLSETVVPVWSASIASAEDIQTPTDLKRFTLIHDENMARISEFPTWGLWLDNVDLSIDDFEQGPRLPLSSMAIEAAVNGQGVVLGRSVLIYDEVQRGDLLTYTETPYPLTFGYFVEQHALDNRSDEAKIFASWLKKQASMMPDN